MKYLYLLTILILIGCANCSNGDLAPNIRQMSGAECCPAYCAVVTTKQCTGYYETLPINLPDGGIQNMDCNTFCQYMLSNSIPLNPCCIKNTLQTCDQIENICK